MKKIFLILGAAALFASCTKQDYGTYDKSQPLIGKWSSSKATFTINNLTGIGAPFYVTKVNDSLHVVLLPLIDLNYKIISVDAAQLIVSDKIGTITFNRIDRTISMQ